MEIKIFPAPTKFRCLNLANEKRKMLSQYRDIHYTSKVDNWVAGKVFQLKTPQSMYLQTRFRVRICQCQ